jgi:carbamoyltransferase
MKGSYLGPKFDGEDIKRELNLLKANFKEYKEVDLIEIISRELSEEKTIGWFQGRMEFGPRALGGRSILADPRSEKIQKELNLKVKFRESFRPFAPSVLSEEVENWFDLDISSPYMLLVADIKKKIQIPMTETQKNLFGIDKLNIKRSRIPAVTHVDYSARIQTVHKETHPRFYNLIKKFHERTGCPILVNTSFNIRGEPIVCTINDAFICFMGTDLDILVCENIILYKKDQDKSLKKDYRLNFKLD